MAAEGVKLTLFLALVIMLYHGANGQSSCTSTLLTLSPCLNYVTGNSSTPSSSCCTKLASVVQSQPQCLCTFVNGGGVSSLGISINQTLALSLPAACSVTTPPTSRCNGGGSGTSTSPASSPESPPADSSSDTPTTNTTLPAESGSKTVPTTATTSDSSNLGFHLSLTIFLASIVLWASNNVGF